MLRQEILLNQGARKDHKGPVVSQSRSPQVSTVTCPTTIPSMAVVSLYFALMRRKPFYQSHVIGQKIYLFLNWDVGDALLGKTGGCKWKASSQEMHDLESKLWGQLGRLHKLALRFRGESASRTEKPCLFSCRVSISASLHLLVLLI